MFSIILDLYLLGARSIDICHHLWQPNYLQTLSMSLVGQTCPSPTEIDFKVLRELENKLWEMREEERELIGERENEHDNKWTESGLVAWQSETFEGPADLRQWICSAPMHQDLQLHYFLQKCTATWIEKLPMQLMGWPKFGTFAYQMSVKQKDEGIRALKLCRILLDVSHKERQREVYLIFQAPNFAVLQNHTGSSVKC